MTKHYLNFLVAGGSTSATEVRLVVSGSTVLTASGQQDLTLRWTTWDLSPWSGQSVTVQIVDSTGAGWGIIAADQFVESDSNNPVGRFGGDMISTGSVVTKWGDWNVDFKLPDANGHEVDVTMARGIPFTWTTWKGGINPKFVMSGTTALYNTSNGVITTGSSFVTNAFSFNYQGRTYGVFLPDNTTVLVNTGYIEPQLSGSNKYMVIGYLPATTNLAEFAGLAFARPTDTKISWAYDPAAGMVNTTWNVTTTAMKGSNLQTLQGWIPHHYRTTTNSLAFKAYTYLTPRGIMKCSQGNSFQIGFPFKGIAPVLPAPVVTGTVNDYQPARMANLMKIFQPGSMIGDTYWGGKALGICAQYMAWANQMGDTTDYLRLKSALKTALSDWLTYTPGETNGFFAYYPNWHAMIGSDASYGSQAFNDLHFHYGYFAVAAATLGMYDPQFLADYGPMLKEVVKCYGNFDRNDNSEPFLRTFDIWEGHDNAGGTSSPGGENQESSSEGVQAWGGMFLLGSVTNDSAMQAAAAMCFSMESAAVNEYWQDLWQTNFPSVYGRAGNGILGSGGLAYGTFFSGDPAWVYAIQYCPSNHWLNYMIRYKPDVVATKYQAMWDERSAWCSNQLLWTSTDTYPGGKWVQYNSHIYSVSGTATLPAGQPAPDVNPGQWNLQADCSKMEPDVLGDSPGHVVLVYQALWDHDKAAAEFDAYYSNNKAIATSAGDGGSSYYLIHAMREIGDQDWNYTTSIPTSAVYVNAATGVRTYVVYNPAAVTRQAIVYNNGVATGTMTVPAMVTVNTSNPNYNAATPPVPSGLSVTSGSGQVVLSWNSLPTATGYNVVRATSLSGTYSLIASPSTPTCTDTNSITNGATYYYMVSASNSQGQSSYSAPFAASVVPLAPTLSGTLTGGHPELSWNNPGGATSYNVKRSTKSGSGYASVSGTISSLTFTDVSAATGRNYYYIVTALDTGGESGNSNEILLNTISPPSIPTGLTAALGNAQVTLDWTDSTGSPASYNVRRSLSSGGPYTIITSASTSSWTDTNVTNGLTYYYVVSAVNGGGETVNSSEVTTKVLAPPVFAVNCNGASVGQFVADNASYYSNPGGNSNTTGTMDMSAVFEPAPQAVYQSNRYGQNMTYALGGFTAGATYNVRLHFSEAYWTLPGKRVYQVFVNGAKMLSNYDIFATSGTNFKANIQEITAAANGSGTFTFLFSSTPAGADNAQINGIEIRIPRPTVPSGLTATPSSAQIALNWSGSTTNATSYNIKRATVSGGPYNVIASSTTTNFTDTTVSGNSPYYYVVSSVNAGGESLGNSNEAGSALINQITGSFTEINTTNVNLDVIGSLAYVRIGYNTNNPDSQIITASSLLTGFSHYGTFSNSESESPQTTTYTYNDGANTDGYGTGTPTVSAGENMVGTGYQITVPNNPQNVILYLYVSENNANTLLTAGNYTNTTASGASQVTGFYTLNIPANYGNVTISYAETAQLGSYDNVRVFAAALASTVVPRVPTGLSAVSGSSQVTLSWNPSSGVTSYNVMRAATVSGSYATIASTQTPGYNDTNVTNASTYYYSVTAVNTVGESANSAQANATLSPVAPSGFSTAAGTGQVSLSWNSCPGATAYNVNRATASGGSYTTIATPSTASYTDSGVANGTTYFYVVSAVNTGGTSANSTEMSAQPLSPIQQWRLTNFGTINPADAAGGDTATPKGDRVPNLIKYALGLDPAKVALSSGLPSAAVSSGYLNLTFTRLKSVTDVTYRVEGTGDFFTWTEVWNSTVNAYGGGNNDSQQVTVPDTVPVSSAPNHRRFMRLKVTRP
ncbi:MAG: glycosyl hydrolase [Verrucomicrobiota bacterium]